MTNPQETIDLDAQFIAKMKAAKITPVTPERVFTVANLAVGPGDIQLAIHTKSVKESQQPIFGTLPLRMPKYYDKKAEDYKKRLLSNCKFKNTRSITLKINI